MAKHPAGAGITTGLREALEALPGVRRVLIDGAPARLYLLCDPPGGYPPIESAVRALLAREGLHAGGAQVEVAYLGAPPLRRRVRFVDSSLRHARAGVAAATVRLEWNERIYEGTAEGESSPAGDLRICAQATLRALEAVLEGVMSFQLVGIKATRIFDNDMIAVVLYSSDEPDRRLVGSSMVAQESCRSAALAVLNATNRMLGNYLATSD